MQIYDEQEDGLVLRVRLTPNSSSCSIKGVFTDAQGYSFLKINVISVPEKGKANQELISFLAKKLNLAKSQLKIISGETDRYKRIFITEPTQNLVQIINKWIGED